jgi:ParB family chromosome partitioning protein
MSKLRKFLSERSQGALDQGTLVDAEVESDRFRLAKQAAIASNPLRKGGAPVIPVSGELPAGVGGTDERGIPSAFGGVPEGEAGLEFVPLDLIDENPYNARAIYLPERVKEISESLLAHGQKVPGLATVRNGRYVLIAGHYRFRALRANQAAKMSLLVQGNVTDRELFELSHLENDKRTPSSTLDNALSWRKLLNDKVYDSGLQLAEKLGLSEASVSKTLKVLECSEMLLDEIQSAPDKFPFSVLYELYLYEQAGDVHLALLMAKRVISGEVGRKEIQSAREALEDPRQPKRKQRSRMHNLMRDGEKIGMLKEWDSGRVLLELRLPDCVEREKIVEDLRIRFSQQNAG